MTVQRAHQFIRAVRGDPGLRDRVAALGEAGTVEDLVALGAEAGFAFDAGALRLAWPQDWALRSLAAASAGKGSSTGNRAPSARARPE